MRVRVREDELDDADGQRGNQGLVVAVTNNTEVHGGQQPQELPEPLPQGQLRGGCSNEQIDVRAGCSNSHTSDVDSDVRVEYLRPTDPGWWGCWVGRRWRDGIRTVQCKG